MLRQIPFLLIISILFVFSCKKKPIIEGDLVAEGKIVDAFDHSPIKDVVIFIADKNTALGSGGYYYELHVPDTTNILGEFSCAVDSRSSGTYYLVIKDRFANTDSPLYESYFMLNDDFSENDYQEFSAKCLTAPENRDMKIQFGRMGRLKIDVRKKGGGNANDKVVLATPGHSLITTNKDTTVYIRIKPSRKNTVTAYYKDKDVWSNEVVQGLSGDTSSVICQL